MKWVIDPAHSQIQFSAKHMGLTTVRGTFQKFTGDIEEEDGIVTAVVVDIDVASLHTYAEERDNHLRSADFFDVANHPNATFVLTKFERDGNEVTASGDLTIRGVTKPVVLKGEVGGPIVDPWGAKKVSAELETKISRKEWGLVWNVLLEAGGVLVSDDIKLAIEIEAAPAA